MLDGTQSRHHPYTAMREIRFASVLALHKNRKSNTWWQKCTFAVDVCALLKSQYHERKLQVKKNNTYAKTATQQQRASRTLALFFFAKKTYTGLKLRVVLSKFFSYSASTSRVKNVGLKIKSLYSAKTQKPPHGWRLWTAIC